MSQILIIEDEVLLAKSISRSLVGRGHDCFTAVSAEEGLSLMERMSPDVVLLDVQLPGMSGLEAIKVIRKVDPNISIIMATAYGTMASVVEAMRSGACDFLRKPLDIDEVVLAIDRAIANFRLKQTVSYYHSVEAEKTDEDKLICESPKMKKVVDVVEKLTSMSLDQPSDYPPVLILGETGVGKDLIGRYIHFRGQLADEPFVEVNCTTLPSGLEEAELFGYEKGAFTGAYRSKRGLFEAATGGSIFLNEIGDLTKEVQVKLLQVIEQKTMRRVGGLRDISPNVRIIAATNRDLRDESKFRSDLFYRLNNLTVEVPPLRERREDILKLSELFLKKFGQKYGTMKKLHKNVQAMLLNYPWYGNVRELRQLMERATFLSSGPDITEDDIRLPQVHSDTAEPGSANSEIEFPDEGINLEEVERGLIMKALNSSGGNISEAARKLGLGREALRYRIKKFAISKSVKIIG